MEREVQETPRASSSAEEAFFLEFMSSLVEIENGLCKMWLGKILTLIDATTSDPEQRKALKDTIKSIFYDTEHGHLDDLLWLIGNAVTPDNQSNFADEHIQRSYRGRADAVPMQLGKFKIVVGK